MNKNIPDFLIDTEFGNIIKNEREYKEGLLEGIKDFKNNFNLSSSYYYILKFFCTLLRVCPNKADEEHNVGEKLKATLKALINPGTFESILTLFKVFLEVSVELYEDETKPGFLKVKLKNRPKFNKITLIKASSSDTAFSIRTKGKQALLTLNQSDKYYITNFKYFVSTFMLAGVELEIEEPKN